MAAKWNPNPRVLELIRQQAEISPTDRIAVGTRVLDWADVLDEVERGTKFGREYYRAILEGSKAAR